MLNQIDALSHLHIASADHFAREMGYMAECVLLDQKPCTPGEDDGRDLHGGEGRRSVSI
jgi:hypothetical protein